NNVWLQVGDVITNGSILSIAALGNTLYIGGTFTNTGIYNASYVAYLSGTNWMNLGAGINGPVGSLAACGTNLFVGGSFAAAGGLASADCIALWNGQQWETMNGGPDPSSGSNNCLYYVNNSFFDKGVVLSISPRGDRVFVGGVFTNLFNGTNSIPVNGIAMATWSDTEQTWTWS